MNCKRHEESASHCEAVNVMITMPSTTRDMRNSFPKNMLELRFQVKSESCQVKTEVPSCSMFHPFVKG